MLTNRQIEITKLACKGFSNPEIAKELKISPNTVKQHKSDIYKILFGFNMPKNNLKHTRLVKMAKVAGIY